MFSQTRVLLVAIVVALFAWMLGYGMGGGFHIGGKGAADSTDEAVARSSGVAGRKSALHIGTASTAEGTLSDQIAARRIPWTRERLLKTVGSVHHEPDQLHAIRFGMKLIEQLGAADFPLVLDVLDDAIKGTGKSGSLNENDVTRRKLREFAIMRWAELNPEAVAGYLKAQPFQHFNGLSEEIAALCGVWVTSDPAAALAWVKTLPNDNSERWTVLGIVMRATARRDVDGAIALARANPDVISRAGDAINEAVGERDPERNARNMADLGDPKAIGYAASIWATKDHDAALKWAQELPEGKLRTEALSGVLWKFAENHREEAMAWLSQQPADGPSYVAAAAQTIIQNTQDKDLKRITQWVASLQQPDARDSAITHLALHYSADWLFEAGLKWLDTLPSGKERDIAINNFVSNGAGSRSEVRSELAATIQDAKIRRYTLQSAFDGWSRGDPDAAREWLQTSPSISEEDRQAIRKKK